MDEALISIDICLKVINDPHIHTTGGHKDVMG